MTLKKHLLERGVTLSTVNIGKIVGKHPNYLAQMWREGKHDEVNRYVDEAVQKFESICK